MSQQYVSIQAASKPTGLSVSALRRGVRVGRFLLSTISTKRVSIDKGINNKKEIARV